MNTPKPPDSSTKMDESEFDRLVERGSVPSLADLFRRGKEEGLIKPTSNYGEAAAHA